jgi:hypothetical protein
MLECFGLVEKQIQVYWSIEKQLLPEQNAFNISYHPSKHFLLQPRLKYDNESKLGKCFKT